MKVILKSDIKGVGKKYEVKEVSDGYANNFLIPKKLAEHASKEAIKRAEILRVQNLADIEIKENLIKKEFENLKDKKLVIRKKANEKDHLFEQIHNEEISKLLKTELNIDIDKESISTENPIKSLGEHKFFVEIGKTKGEFTLIVERDS